MSKRGAGALTSIDILHERDALRTRVEELERSLRAIEREAERALAFPEINFLTLCRIATITRRARCPGLASCEPDRVAFERVGT